MKLTIFYDGRCPLCVAEMNALQRYDEQKQLIRLENIHSNGFKDRFPHIDVNAANRVLHGVDENGDLLKGLDVTVRAWELVDRKRWLRILRWPIVRLVADQSYLFFAKHRMRISALLLGNRVCQIQPEKAAENRPKTE